MHDNLPLEFRSQAVAFRQAWRQVLAMGLIPIAHSVTMFVVVKIVSVVVAIIGMIVISIAIVVAPMVFLGQSQGGT